MMQTKKQLWLSPTALNLYLSCQKCFWLDKVKKVKRPRGIFPSLPTGMDREIKTYFDQARASGQLPPELAGDALKGIALFKHQANLDEWREWRTGLRYYDEVNNVVFSGMLDDLLVKGDQYVPFDYKTKGSPTSLEDAVKYYQNQLDGYALLLEENGMKTAGFGILIYYSPSQVEAAGQIQFKTQVLRIDTDSARVKARIKAIATLIASKEPPASPDCEYCSWLSQRTSV